jgi:hypothetical protein
MSGWVSLLIKAVTRMAPIALPVLLPLFFLHSFSWIVGSWIHWLLPLHSCYRFSANLRPTAHLKALKIWEYRYRSHLPDPNSWFCGMIHWEVSLCSLCKRSLNYRKGWKKACAKERRVSVYDTLVPPWLSNAFTLAWVLLREFQFWTSGGRH